MKCSRMFGALALVSLTVTPALSAGVIYDQGWEDTTQYAPGKSTNDPGANNMTTGGRWFNFSNPAPGISNTVAHSGAQSAFIQRAATDGSSGSLPALVSQSLIANTDTQYDATLWINRTHANSAATFGLADASPSGDSLIAAYITTNGDIRYGNDTSYTYTGITLPANSVGNWVQLRFSVDLTNDTYNLYFTPDGGTETQVTPTGGFAFTHAPDNLRNFTFAPSGPQGPDSRIYIDDISVTTHPIPEPGALGLLGLGGLLCMGRRKRCN